VTAAVGRIREAIEKADRRLSSTEHLRAMHAGTASRVAYVGHLRVLAVLHAQLERALDAQRDHPVVAAVWDALPRPLEPILEDLQYFRRELVPDVPVALDVAHQLTLEISMAQKLAPCGLLGFLYAACASRTPLPAGPLRAALGLGPHHGAGFLSGAEQDAPAKCARFEGLLDAHLVDPADIEAAAEAAVTALKTLRKAFEPLAPLDDDALGVHVMSLNPEGGSHPVTQDARELAAVLRASDRCLAAHPYIIGRYGERGRRFTDSDGAWQAWLTTQHAALRRKRIDWLGRLLSVRGMPTLILAEHLEVVASELSSAVPEEAERYALLEEEATRLRAQAAAHLRPAEARVIVDEYAERLVGHPDAFAREIGYVLTAACADEAQGIDRAVPAVLAWATDEKRFSAPWIETIDALVAQTRASLAA